MSHGFVPPPHLSFTGLGSNAFEKFYTAKSWAKEMAKSLVRHTQSPDKPNGINTQTYMCRQNYMCRVTKIHG